jgi:hypothetical protein
MRTIIRSTVLRVRDVIDDVQEWRDVREDFSLKALHEALDDRRRSRGLTWAAATREISRLDTPGRERSPRRR